MKITRTMLAVTLASVAIGGDVLHGVFAAKR